MAYGELITTVTAPAAPASATAGAYDLTDLATVKLDLGVTSNGNDTILQLYLSAASIAARTYCNRTFQKESLIDQVWPKRDPFPAQVSGGLWPLQLSRFPITSVPNVSGLAAPVAPTLSVSGGGSLAASRYFVVVSYLTAAGETARSPESALSVAANNLLQIASPVQDSNTPPLATGWNVYIGTASGGETLQNGSPLAIGTPFTLPGSGLISGTALPDYVTVVENAKPLAEGVHFAVDYRLGQLARLHKDTGYTRAWPAWIISSAYSSGLVPIPADVVDAVLRMVKARWFGRTRDPALRSENITGAYEAQYWFASGPGGGEGNLTPDVEAILEKYRVPVIA